MPGCFGLYRLQQKKVLPYLSARMKKYYLFMFERYQSSNWLSYLENGNLDSVRFGEICSRIDEKWCTAGFIHAAGKIVTEKGEIKDKSNSNEKAVFSFQPIDIACDNQARTVWKYTHDSTDRFIFKVEDLTRYQPAMTNALKELFMTLP